MVTLNITRDVVFISEAVTLFKSLKDDCHSCATTLLEVKMRIHIHLHT